MIIQKLIIQKQEIKYVLFAKQHGEFIQTPNDHLSGCGCPKCYNKYSKSQIEWLNFVSKYYNITIQHAENNGEHDILNSKYKADGFCQETNTIYEYHGDYWHGNPKVFDKNLINDKKKMSFGDIYKETIERETFIKEQGYNLVVMWEYDWKKINNSVKQLQKIFKIHRYSS